MRRQKDLIWSALLNITRVSFRVKITTAHSTIGQSGFSPKWCPFYPYDRSLFKQFGAPTGRALWQWMQMEKLFCNHVSRTSAQKYFKLSANICIPTCHDDNANLLMFSWCNFHHLSLVYLHANICSLALKVDPGKIQSVWIVWTKCATGDSILKPQYSENVTLDQEPIWWCLLSP